MTSPVVPSTKGQGQTALADTRASWVNLRSGPGTNYQDIGDIRDGTLVFYYTDTRQGDWVYLEQYGASGWVHTGFVDFKPIEADPPTAPRDATPYDGHVCMWYWEGDSVTEQSIEAVVANVKSQAPQVTQFWLKTSNGHLWQGASDSKKALSVDGPEDIDRWAAILDRYGMELHAWCVPRGSTDIDAEAQVMVQTAQHPAVKSLLLDVEPDRRNYWTGTAAQVRELMLKVRRVIPGDFHIGFVVDPRPWHYETIFPLEWQPFVNSVHPMTYWHTFRITPDEALQQMYGTWLNYGKPIAPIFEVNAPIDEIQQAHSLATARYGARSLSWWRYGIGSTAQMNALSVPIPNSPVEPTPAPTPTPNPGNPEEVDEIIITPDSNRFAKGTYTGREEFKGYVQRMGWPVFYTRTSATAS